MKSKKCTAEQTPSFQDVRPRTVRIFAFLKFTLPANPRAGETNDDRRVCRHW